MANDEGLVFGDWIQPPTVPPDPIGDGWRGPPGDTGPQGPPGPPGQSDFPGYSMAESLAVGDGTTDDRPVIQAFLDTLAATYGGAEVILPPGKWYAILSAPLTIPANVIVRGAYSAQNNQNASGTGFFSGGGFLINPALPYGIRLNTSSTLKNCKVYRTGMVANASSGVAAAAYTQWATEAVYRQCSATVASGVTVIPIADTTGITVGMTVTAGQGANFGPGALTVTVASIVTNTSVTVTTGVAGGLGTLPIGTWFRFGGSMGVVIGFNCSASVIDEVQIIGFRTGIQVFAGQYWIRDCRGDCITNIDALSGGDTASVLNCEYVPLYGVVSQSRQGASFFIHDGGVSTHWSGCFCFGWLIGWHIYNAQGPQFTTCDAETMNILAEVESRNWLIEGGFGARLFGCHAQAGAVGFDLNGTNVYNLYNCSSTGYQVASAGANIAHFRVDNAGVGYCAGSIINPHTASGYPDKVPYKFGAGSLNACNLINPSSSDIARSIASTTVPFVQGTLPNTTVPRLSQGLIYTTPGGGSTTLCLPYWNGLIIGHATTVSTMTITLPPYPADKQSFPIFFNSSVTTLTVNSSDGSTIGKYTNPGDGTLQEWIYIASQNTWYCGGAAASSGAGSYLPLAGGTLTGALGGTTATFSGLLTAPSLTVAPAAGTSALSLFTFTRNSVTLGTLDTVASNAILRLTASSRNLRFATDTSMDIMNGAGLALANFQALTSPSADYVQMGPATTTGAYIRTISAGNAPLDLAGSGTGVVHVTSGLTVDGTVSGAGFTSLLASYAALASPTFTGTVTTPGLTTTGSLLTLGSGTGAVPFDLNVAGTSNFRFNMGATTGVFTIFQQASGSPAFRVLGTASAAANYLTVQPGLTGTSVILQAVGTDTNVSMNLAGQGTGVVRLVSNTEIPGTLVVAGTVSGAGITSLLAPYAPLASPTFTGTVTIPSGASIAGFAPLASPAFTGNPTAPTATFGDNDTSVATTAFVQAALAGAVAGVSSFNTRTGAVTLATGDVTGLGAYAGTFTTISATGAITSTLATGSAPFVVASTTNVANLNASSLSGATFAAPGAIGGTTPGSGAFTTLSASGTVSGAGFTAWAGSPPPIGGTASAAGAFTTLVASSTVSGAGFTTLLSPYAPLASPTFTGTPAAPTAALSTNTTQLATTAFVIANRRNHALLQAQWVNGAIVTNDTVWMSYDAPYAGTINTLKHVTGTGSFTVAIKINGTNVTSLSAVSVTSTPATATATAANTFTAGDVITAVISSASGSPTGSMLSLDLTWS